GAARPFPSPAYLFADSCGTGGDFSRSINVSTAAGIVAAACGLPVVKHGNRSFTSQFGSGDVLQALGARLDLSALESRHVPDPKLLLPIAQTLRALGVERALVVHGSGLDEVALHGFTSAVLLIGDELEPIEITPEQAGLVRMPVEAIEGGSPAENARRMVD